MATRAITETISALRPTKLKNVKDTDEKRWKIEGAASTFKRKAEIEREIKDIKADPELIKAVRELLKQEAADTKKAQAI